MPREKLLALLVSFISLAIVIVVTTKIRPSKDVVLVYRSPFRVIIAPKNDEQIWPINDLNLELSSETPMNNERQRLERKDQGTASAASDSESQFTVITSSVNEANHSVASTESGSARNVTRMLTGKTPDFKQAWQLPRPGLADTKKGKAPLKLYAAMADPPPGCREAHCMEYLTEVEKQDMEECDEEIRYRYHRIPDDSSCNFMDRSQGRLPVALASSEGSGNTWVRGLLERASGICTGYEVCDYMMRAHGFIGEKIKSGSVLVVKTHNAKPHWHQAVQKPASTEAEGFGSAIYILRNPYNSAIAEWHRRATNMILIKKKIPHNESHTNIAAAEYFTGELYQSTCRIKTYV